VTDRQTDRQTDGRADRQNYDSQDRASIAASRDKKDMLRRHDRVKESVKSVLKEE